MVPRFRAYATAVQARSRNLYISVCHRLRLYSLIFSGFSLRHLFIRARCFSGYFCRHLRHLSRAFSLHRCRQAACHSFLLFLSRAIFVPPFNHYTLLYHGAGRVSTMLHLAPHIFEGVHSKCECRESDTRVRKHDFTFKNREVPPPGATRNK